MSETHPNPGAWLGALGVGGLVWFWMDRKTKEREALEADRAELARLARGDRTRVAASTTRAAGAATAPHTPTTARPPGQAALASRGFDPVFASYGHGLPVSYLRALALRESDLNPRAVTGSAVGLLQVIDIVRRGFNERHGTRYARRDLFDPAINVTIGTDVLTRIVDAYERFHPDVPNLRADWDNPRFVELLTFGWNAGFSERAGVGHVVDVLTARGQRDLTIDDVHRAAKGAKASPHLSNPAKVRFAKAVTAQYLRERTRDDTDGQTAPGVATAPPAPPPSPVSSPDQVDHGPAATTGAA
ncbi:MAG: transglycosylase SLT domain-containing protein [Planctomycetes bacterium]|nr:transglycosylase SLT domain-containing protein [Planctomycetota bacterium]